VVLGCRYGLLLMQEDQFLKGIILMELGLLEGSKKDIHVGVGFRLKGMGRFEGC